MGLVSSDGRNGCGKMKQSRSTQGRGADAGGARAGNGFSVDLLRSGRPRLKSLLIYSSLVQTAIRQDLPESLLQTQRRGTWGL